LYRLLEYLGRCMDLQPLKNWQILGDLMKQSNYDDNAFLPNLTLIGIVGMIGLVLILYTNGTFDDVKTWLDDFLAMLLDGTDLGNWLGGIVVGVIVGLIKGLWDFGTDIGLGASDML
jgi:hypothetical protein